MTRGSDRQSDTDSEAASIRIGRVRKLGAIICPFVCALLLVSIFAISFIGPKLAYNQYGAFCYSRRIDGAKLYIFPDTANLTVKIRPA